MRLSAPAETRQIAGSYVSRTSTMSPRRVTCTIGTAARRDHTGEHEELLTGGPGEPIRQRHRARDRVVELHIKPECWRKLRLVAFICSELETDETRGAPEVAWRRFASRAARLRHTGRCTGEFAPKDCHCDLR
jgi:hypothetical protein